MCEYFLLDLIRNQANFQLCWNWTFLRTFLEIGLFTNKAFWLKAKKATEDWSFEIHRVYIFDLSSTVNWDIKAHDWLSSQLSLSSNVWFSAECWQKSKSKQENFVKMSRVKNQNMYLKREMLENLYQKRNVQLSPWKLKVALKCGSSFFLNLW